MTKLSLILSPSLILVMWALLSNHSLKVQFWWPTECLHEKLITVLYVCEQIHNFHPASVASLCLDQWLSTRGPPPHPPDICQCLETFLVTTAGATSVSWVEDKEGAKRPMTRRTASAPQRGLSSPKYQWCSVEKPWSRWAKVTLLPDCLHPVLMLHKKGHATEMSRVMWVWLSCFFVFFALIP